MRTEQLPIYPEIKHEIDDPRVSFRTRVRFKDANSGLYYLREVFKTYLMDRNTTDTVVRCMGEFVKQCVICEKLAVHDKNALFTSPIGEKMPIDTLDSDQTDEAHYFINKHFFPLI